MGVYVFFLQYVENVQSVSYPLNPKAKQEMDGTSLQATTGTITNVMTVCQPVNLPSITVNTIQEKVKPDSQFKETSVGNQGGSFTSRGTQTKKHNPKVKLWRSYKYIIQDRV